ncbi:DUF4342 domain-containing protein [Romboutsia sp.]|uniref:DUF4342 domain-containing protein n=1 Tax=Romboutsia sp. TaxID=1965302 RepID=UPI003F2FC397
MEKITMEQIDAVKTRANVGYKEAKEVLEKFGGDVVAAILYLENENKTKTDIKEDSSRYYTKGKGVIKRLNEIEIKVYKKEKIALNIPASLAIVSTVFAPHITIGGLVVSIFTGYKIKIENLKDKESQINQVLYNASTKANEFAQKATDEITKL